MDADELEIWRALNELPEVKAVFGAGYTGDRVYILTVAAACQYEPRGEWEPELISWRIGIRPATLKRREG
jgi:hypothetical protein